MKYNKKTVYFKKSFFVKFRMGKDKLNKKTKTNNNLNNEKSLF